MRRAAAIAAIAVALASAPARADVEYHQFHSPREQVAGVVKTVAIRHVMSQPTIREHEAVLPQLDAELAKALEGAGYKVVGPSIFDSIWRDNARRLGGVWDIATGELDKEAFQACYEYTTRELARLYGIDAVVVPTLATGSIDGGFIDTLKGGSRAYAVGDVMTIGGKEIRTNNRQQMQYVDGIFFDMSVYDLSGASLYSTTVPIEWTRVYWNRSYIDRDLAPLSRPETNAAAVRTAVRPLNQTTVAAPAPASKK